VTATVSDNDYVAVDTTLTFNPGDTEQDLHLTIIGDKVFEPDETFLVNAQIVDAMP
jgi:hypothetical protein